jgi:carboxyl-terminal processing protease
MWKTSEKVSIFSGEKMDMKDFWEVYEIIEKDYFTQDAIQKEDLLAWAISWMVNALWDRHSEFMNPEITQKFNEVLEGDFEWIGAVVEKVPLWVKIERILKGSPAKKYDVRWWDIIIKANDINLDELDIYDAVDVIKWPAGSQVSLTILRSGEDEILEISVTRERIHIPSVEQEYFKDGNIAYIAINMFGDSTAQEFIIALDEVKKSGVDGLIIDVRDNGGWYLQSAVQILSEFIPEKEILVKTRYKNSFFDENYLSVNDGNIYDKNIIVLINENSASASEITAWALREYDKAILIGQKTYWKGSVQQPFDMADWSLLKLTVAKWFTPDGKNIDDEGIMPDIEIEFLEEDYESQYDRQLEEAKEILKIFIEKDTIWLTIEEYKKQNVQ